MRAMWAVGIVLLLAILAGCSKDKVTGPKASEITGTWNATKAEYVCKADQNLRMDVVGTGGSARLTLDPASTYEFIIAESGEPPDTTSGTWRVQEDELIMQPANMPWNTAFKVQLSGSTLSLTGGDMIYDFGDDGTPDESDLNLTFVRYEGAGASAMRVPTRRVARGG